MNDELEKARATYSEMLTCAKAHSEPEMECEALNRLATVTAHVAVNVYSRDCMNMQKKQKGIKIQKA